MHNDPQIETEDVGDDKYFYMSSCTFHQSFVNHTVESSVESSTFMCVSLVLDSDRFGSECP